MEAKRMTGAQIMVLLSSEEHDAACGAAKWKLTPASVRVFSSTSSVIGDGRIPLWQFNIIAFSPATPITTLQFGLFQSLDVYKRLSTQLFIQTFDHGHILSFELVCRKYFTALIWSYFGLRLICSLSVLRKGIKVLVLTYSRCTSGCTHSQSVTTVTLHHFSEVFGMSSSHLFSFIQMETAK